MKSCKLKLSGYNWVDTNFKSGIKDEYSNTKKKFN